MSRTSQEWHETLREKMGIRPEALAALERQAEREEMTLGELVGCLLEKAASRVLIAESMDSIAKGVLCDESAGADKGFDIGGGD